VGLRVGLGRLGGMVGRIGVVPVCYVCVMGRFLVVSCFMMRGCFPVMAGGVLVMLCGLLMVVHCFF